MLRLRGKLELAGAAEGAVNRLLRHDPLDGIDSVVEGLVKRDGALLAQRLFRADEAMGHAVVEMAAIAPGCTEADRHSLQHHDLGAGHGELAGGGQPGEAAANDRDVVLAFDRPRSGAREGYGSVMPIGFKPHLAAPACPRSGFALQRPKTPGRPPMSLISV